MTFFLPGLLVLVLIFLLFSVVCQPPETIEQMLFSLIYLSGLVVLSVFALVRNAVYALREARRGLGDENTPKRAHRYPPRS